MDQDSSFTIVIGDTGETFRCHAEQTLLAGMETLGRKGIRVGCRGGGCGVCKVHVESGVVRAARMSRARLSAEEEAAGLVLACRAYPRSDLRVRAIAQMVAGEEADKAGSFLTRSQFLTPT